MLEKGTWVREGAQLLLRSRTPRPTPRAQCLRLPPLPQPPGMALSFIKPSLANGSWKPRGCWLCGGAPAQPRTPKTGCRLPLPLPRPVSAEGGDTPGQQSQSALASASAGRQMANTPCQCREGLRHGRPGEHCGSALLRNLLWLPSFSQWEAPLQGEPERLGGGAQLHYDLLQNLRQVAQTT